eukprot:CFRG3081T1
MSRNVVVLGTGIVGLTTAVRLCEEGHTVHVWTKALAGLASDNCGGLWEPYNIHPADVVIPLCLKTRTRLIQELDQVGDATGLRSYPMWIMFREGSEEEMANLPAYSDEIGLRFISPGQDRVVEPYVGSWTCKTIVASMPEYMEHLRHELQHKYGVEIRVMKEPSTDISLTHADVKQEYGNDTVMVNCTGLASRNLCSDMECFPLRGVVVKTTVPVDSDLVVLIDERNPDGVSYIIPNGPLVTLGGITKRDSWDETASEDEARGILYRCTNICPALKEAEVVKTWAGLRPCRTSLRLEVDVEEPTLVHNYGHGGAGFTASWGCADRVCELVNEMGK